MDKRLTLGIIYSRNENWIAGSYYIENLVFALKSQKKYPLPRIKVYSEEEESYRFLQNLTDYPEMSFVLLKDNQNFLDKIINKISYLIAGKHTIIKGIDNEVDVLFPASNTYFFDKFANKLFWIPDFQEKHYPDFFPKNELKKRDNQHRLLVTRKSPIVFSSNDSLKDFNLHYHHSNRTFVLPFAVTLPSVDKIKLNEVVEKYAVPEIYFICSNQFWPHKNHEIVLQAVDLLKKKGIDVSVIFTGKMNDSRQPGYINKLHSFIKDNDLSSNINFLGFIDRAEQLILMKNSLAIIQPSKFEGWSTVVEDAKCLNHPIIVSDIGVHIEQLGSDYKFKFGLDDARMLAFQMEQFISNKTIVIDYHYGDQVNKFGEEFMRIANNVIKN